MSLFDSRGSGSSRLPPLHNARGRQSSPPPDHCSSPCWSRSSDGPGQQEPDPFNCTSLRLDHFPSCRYAPTSMGLVCRSVRALGSHALSGSLIESTSRSEAGCSPVRDACQVRVDHRGVPGPVGYLAHSSSLPTRSVPCVSTENDEVSDYGVAWSGCVYHERGVRAPILVWRMASRLCGVQKSMRWLTRCLFHFLYLLIFASSPLVLPHPAPAQAHQTQHPQARHQ
jgi:hypothetical protein